MTRQLTLALAAILIFGVLPRAATADEASVRALLDDYARAVKTLDLELAERIWSQDPSTSFIHPRGHQRGWEDIRENFYVGAMGRLSERELVLKDISIRILDEDNAWADFYWDFAATFPDGTEITSAGRETQLFRREADGWQIMHVHYSSLPVSGEREGF